MASSNILSETLSAITEIKLEELSSQQAHFEEGKKDLLKSVDAETNQVSIVIESVSPITPRCLSNYLKLNLQVATFY